MRSFHWMFMQHPRVPLSLVYFLWLLHWQFAFMFQLFKTSYELIWQLEGRTHHGGRDGKKHQVAQGERRQKLKGGDRDKRKSQINSRPNCWYFNDHDEDDHDDRVLWTSGEPFKIIKWICQQVVPYLQSNIICHNELYEISHSLAAKCISTPASC